MEGDATGVANQPSETIEITDEDVTDAAAAGIEDAEIERAVEKIAPSKDSPPVGTGTELPKPAIYISNSEFEAAGGAPDAPDKESKEKTLEEIRKQHGIKFKPPADMSDSIVTSLRCLLIDGITIADEETLKSALLVVLPAMNGRKFTLDDQLRNQRPNVLYSMFRRELRSRGKKELADKLETGSGRTSPPPLPPPSTKK